MPDIGINGLILGQEQDCVGGCFEQHQSLAGNVDELYIFSRAINYAEVQELYAGGFSLNADFSADVQSGNPPLEVSFTDLSEGYPLSWNWDFGDGSPQSTLQNPMHVFENPGEYTVTLTIANGILQSEKTYENYISVIPPVVPDEINLSNGWNLISLDIIPDPATPESVFSPDNLTCTLEIVTGFQNQQGVFYDPNGLPYLNTLSQVVPGEGYWVKVDGNGTLTVEGAPIPADQEINLSSGWNLIGYWLPDAQTPEQAFAPLINAGVLEIVTGFENGGLIYDPDALPIFNTLTEVKNGFGYWVKLNTNYPDFSFPSD